MRPKDIRAWPLPIPPLAEQRRIGDAVDELLSGLDAGVAALHRVRAKLALYRASVLKAAVEGSLTAAWRAQHPDVEPASMLLESILVERRCQWEEEQLARFRAKGLEPPKNWKATYREPSASRSAGLASLPRGWTWVSVDQVLRSPIVNGISVRGSDSPPGIPALRLNAMAAGGFDYARRRYLPLESEDVADLWIRAGDFFVSRANGSKHLVGRGTLAQEPPDHVIFPDTMMRLRLVPSGFSPRWIATLWPSGLVRKQIARRAKTTAGIWKLSQPDVAGIVVPLPTEQEQAAIIESVEGQLSVVDHIEVDLDAKLQAAQSLRQAILRHAFSGKLVPQDPTDEPASELLKRIAADRSARLSNAAKARPVPSARRRAAVGERP